MSLIQVALRATPATLAPLEEMLFAAGAVSIALVSDADEPVLEPAPGETPLWSEINLRASFELSTDLQPLRLALADFLPDTPVEVSFLGEEWRQALAGHAVNEVFAGRLWLRPRDPEWAEHRGGASGTELAAPPGAVSDPVQLLLQPGLAFGSGSHPTTRLCLTWLAEHVRAGQRLLDFGCGSGILGIAGALLGGTCVAVDHDPQALLATADNATYNKLTHKDITTLALSDWYAQQHKQTFDIVVANILAAPLQDLAEDFEAVAKPGAHIVLSGILAEQAESVSACYTRTRFQAPRREQGWVLLSGVVAPAA